MKTHEGLEFHTATLGGTECSATGHDRVTPSIHGTGGWVGPDTVWILWRKENLLPLPETEPLFLGREDHSPTLNRPNYFILNSLHVVCTCPGMICPPA
jgi:hypothetical protein